MVKELKQIVESHPSVAKLHQRVAWLNKKLCIANRVRAHNIVSLEVWNTAMVATSPLIFLLYNSSDDFFSFFEFCLKCVSSLILLDNTNRYLDLFPSLISAYTAVTVLFELFRGLVLLNLVLIIRLMNYSDPMREYLKLPWRPIGTIVVCQGCALELIANLYGDPIDGITPQELVVEDIHGRGDHAFVVVSTPDGPFRACAWYGAAVPCDSDLITPIQRQRYPDIIPSKKHKRLASVPVKDILMGNENVYQLTSSNVDLPLTRKLADAGERLVDQTGYTRLLFLAVFCPLFINLLFLRNVNLISMLMSLFSTSTEMHDDVLSNHSLSFS